MTESAESKLAALTALLSPEPGQDVVERARALVDNQCGKCCDDMEASYHAASEALAEKEPWARQQCEALGFPVPPSKAPFDWLTEQIGSLFRAWQFESGEHYRHHKVEDELRAALAEKTSQLENVLDTSKEGAWQARALDAERENAKLRERVAELEHRDGTTLGLHSEPCPACGKFSRAETAGCDHCDYEDK